MDNDRSSAIGMQVYIVSINKVLRDVFIREFAIQVPRLRIHIYIFITIIRSSYRNIYIYIYINLIYTTRSNSDTTHRRIFLSVL